MWSWHVEYQVKKRVIYLTSNKMTAIITDIRILSQLKYELPSVKSQLLEMYFASLYGLKLVIFVK